MNAYFNSIISIAVLGGIASSLITSEKLKKYVRYLISLITILIILSPIASMVSNFDSIKYKFESFIENAISGETISKANSIIVSTSLEKITDGIKELIINKYNLNNEEISVEAVVDSSKIESIKITQINIYLN